MAYFVFLEKVEVESKNPNIQDKDPNAPPSWEVSRKVRVVFHAQTSVNDDEDESPQDYYTGANSEAHEEIVPLRSFFCLCGKSQELSCDFALYTLVKLYIKVLNFSCVILLYFRHSGNLSVVGNWGGSHFLGVFLVFL